MRTMTHLIAQRGPGLIHYVYFFFLGNDFTLTFDGQTLNIPSVEIPLSFNSIEFTVAFWFKLTTIPLEGKLKSVSRREYCSMLRYLLSQ